MEAPERDSLIPSDNASVWDVRGRRDTLALGPISLGERRRVAGQREVLKSGYGVSQASADYLPQRSLSQPESGNAAGKVSRTIPASWLETSAYIYTCPRDRLESLGRRRPAKHDAMVDFEVRIMRRRWSPLRNGRTRQ